MSQGRAHPSTAPIVGAQLGNYRVISELSSGGMGSVYRARHELLGRPAAIKVLRADLTENDELVERFFNEARAATAIRHPGIIEVFDFGHAPDGRAYLVMELLEGEPLTDRITRRKRVPEPEAAQIARGIASALTAAHSRGIVHRDLKPDNVFLVPDPDVPNGERPKVLDFGIAKLADPVGLPTNARHTATGTLMGTPLYMAPEQARAAGEIDARADLYSLGCILYEMLVGEPPFNAVGPGEIIALQLFGKPVPPSERGVELSPELEQIVMRLLEKEPADRFQSATELSEALVAITGKSTLRGEGTFSPPIRPRGEPDVATEVSGPPGAARRRTFVLASLVALAVASAAIAVVVVLATGGDDREAAAPAPPPPPAIQTAPAAQPPPAALVTSPTPPAPQEQVAPPKPAPKPQRVKAPAASPDKKCAGAYSSGAHTSDCSPVETTVD